MRTIGAFEAKTRLGGLLDEVARGETIMITRRGKPIAMLVPPPQPQAEDLKRVIDEMLMVRERSGPRLAGLKIRDLIEEGRRR
jgi:prevent-host-death family protein